MSNSFVLWFLILCGVVALVAILLRSRAGEMEPASSDQMMPLETYPSLQFAAEVSQPTPVAEQPLPALGSVAGAAYKIEYFNSDGGISIRVISV